MILPEWSNAIWLNKKKTARFSRLPFSPCGNDCSIHDDHFARVGFVFEVDLVVVHPCRSEF